MAFAVVLQVIYRLALPSILETVFDGGIEHHNGHVLRVAIIQFALLLLAFIIAAVLQERGMAGLAVIVSRRLRAAIFGKLIAMPMQSQARRGLDILDRMGADVDAIELATVQALPVSFMQGATTAASIVLLFMIEWRLALLVVISLPVMIQLAKPFDHRAEPAREKMTAIRTRLLDLTQEASAGHTVLRLLGVGPAAVRRFLGLVDDMDAASSRWLFFSALSVRAGQAAAGVTQLAVIGIGAASLAFRHEMSAGQVVAFVTLLANVTNGVCGLRHRQIAGGCSTAARQPSPRSMLCSERPTRLPTCPTRSPCARPSARSASTKVTFAYDDAEPILHDVNFTVSSRRAVCLVGPSGSGKTTVAPPDPAVAAALRLGTRWTGIPLEEVTEASLRAAVTAVPQASTLFEGTALRESDCHGAAQCHRRGGPGGDPWRGSRSGGGAPAGRALRSRSGAVVSSCPVVSARWWRSPEALLASAPVIVLDEGDVRAGSHLRGAGEPHDRRRPRTHGVGG